MGVKALLISSSPR